MTAIAAALAVIGCAVAAWDVARRWIAARAADDRETVASLTRVVSELSKWRERVDEERRQDGAAKAFGRRG